MDLSIVYDRFTITVAEVATDDSDSNASVVYEISIDDVKHAAIRLQKYFPPRIGVYRDDRCAVWGGGDIAVAMLDGSFVSATLPEPVHAIYRLSGGWIVVAEISVYVLDESLKIVQRRIHNEVIMRSFWRGAMLVLTDFGGQVFSLSIEKAALKISDFQVYEIPPE